MRKTTLRRLEALEEALEKEERSREQEEQAPLARTLAFIWMIVFAYYLGGLKPDKHKYEDEYEGPREAHARALNYPAASDFYEAIRNPFDLDLSKRHIDAYRRLFAKVGLDFDSAAPSVLFDAFVTMVNQLPEQWLNWLKATLQECCPSAKIGAGSNIPRELSGGNFLLWVEVSS
jgi:hypothetical protein